MCQRYLLILTRKCQYCLPCNSHETGVQDGWMGKVVCPVSGDLEIESHAGDGDQVNWLYLQITDLKLMEGFACNCLKGNIVWLMPCNQIYTFHQKHIASEFNFEIWRAFCYSAVPLSLEPSECMGNYICVNSSQTDWGSNPGSSTCLSWVLPLES